MGNVVYADEVAKRIRLRSEELGVSQVDVARATNAAKSTVNAWFNGGAVPRGENSVILCKILRCTSDWLFSGKGNPISSDAADLLMGLDALHSVKSLEEIKTFAVMVPKLCIGEEGVYFREADASIFTKDSLTGASDIGAVGWSKVLSRSASNMVNPGDTILVDTSIKTINVSGGYYLIGTGSLTNTFQVFVEVDGSWLIVDSSRQNAQTVIDREMRHNIDVIGRVVFRCGPLV